jgi:hypothetical protein
MSGELGARGSKLKANGKKLRVHSCANYKTAPACAYRGKPVPRTTVHQFLPGQIIKPNWFHQKKNQVMKTIDFTSCTWVSFVVMALACATIKARMR